jgi:hypothetical protein
MRKTVHITLYVPKMQRKTSTHLNYFIEYQQI